MSGPYDLRQHDLQQHGLRVQAMPMAELIAADPQRARDFALRVGPLYASFARQRYDRQAWAALLQVAADADLSGALRRLFDGELVNVTEQRAALHSALRSDLGRSQFAREAHAKARAAQQQMAQLRQQLEASEVTDIISVGVGGSDLGPRLVVDALAPANPRFRLHFLSNVDGHALQRCLSGLDPRHTAVVLVSKSFGTQETLLNGQLVRQWLGDDRRLHAVTANTAKAQGFGIAPERCLPMWDWVGGRYSLWSAVGFPVALAIGMPGFEQLLAGAAQMDEHALAAPAEANLPIRHALTAVWNRNALGACAQAVLPYDERLRLLPAYLQQLVMESLGKQVRTDGSPVSGHTVPVWWGGAGSDVQHSFFQALHQGTDVVPADFIGVRQPDHPHRQLHEALLSSLLAQVQALANGQASDDPHRIHPGGRPSTVLLLDRLDAHGLGMLIALYEHSVYLQSVLWGINAFDQFGVELGKQLAGGLQQALQGGAQAEDAVTAALLAELRQA